MKNHRIWYSIVCFFAVIAYIMENNGISLVFIISLLVIPIFSFWFQKISIHGSFLEMKLNASCYIDQNIPIKIKIHKKNRILSGPLSIRFLFHNTLYGDTYEKEVILQPSEHQEMMFEYPVTMHDCGNIKISVVSAKYYDLLGLFSFHCETSFNKEILVYPAQLHLNTILQRTPQTLNDGEFYDDSKHGHDVNEVSGLREYIEGDSPRSIHWKLSSKIDKLVVRQFGYPSNYDTLILYQMSKKIHDIKISNALNNAVLALCTSISYSILEKNLEHEVGHIIQEDFHSTPVSSRSTHEQMVLNLLYKPIEEEENSNDVIYHFLRSNLKTKYTKVIYITPEYDESSIRQLARDVDLTIVQVVDGKIPEHITTTGYSLTSVNIETYEQNTHNILI